MTLKLIIIKMTRKWTRMRTTASSIEKKSKMKRKRKKKRMIKVELATYLHSMKVLKRRAQVQTLI